MGHSFKNGAGGALELEVDNPTSEQQKLAGEINALLKAIAARSAAEPALKDQQNKLKDAAEIAFGAAANPTAAASKVEEVRAAVAASNGPPAYLKKSATGRLESVAAPAGATGEQKDLERKINEAIGLVAQNLAAHPALEDQLTKLEHAAHAAFGASPDEPMATAVLSGVRKVVDEAVQPKPSAPATPSGLVEGIYELTTGERETSRGLQVVMSPDLRASALPADQMALKAAIDDTLVTLKLIFPGKEGERQNSRFIEYRQRLIEVADVGLAGAQVFPAEARQTLDKLRSEIVAREAGRVKNNHMQKLGFYAVAGAAVATAVYAYVRWGLPQYTRVQDFRNFAVLWAGCMLGTWLSFGARRVVLQFDDLGRLEPDMLHPWTRLIFAGTLTMVLGLVFVTNMVNIQIGGLDTAALVKSGIGALMIGIFCGLSEQALPNAVSQRSAQFFSELEKRGGPPPEARTGR